MNLVKGVDDESLGIRKDESVKKAEDEIDLSNPFGIQRRELYKWTR